MNKAAIRSKTDARFKDRIAYMKGEHPDIPFLIAEAASALGNGTGIRDFDLTASLGTALWTVDWLLYAATLVSHSAPSCCFCHFPHDQH